MVVPYTFLINLKMEEKTKSYSNKDITVYWKPLLCIHSAICTKGLPSVFDANKKPWINIDGASKDEIIEVVNKCPSGALSFSLKEGLTFEKEVPSNSEVTVSILKDGPIIINADSKVIDANGNIHHKKGNCALCTCGLSKEKPFCDGSHYNKS